MSLDPTLSVNNLTSTDFQGMIRTNVQNEGYTPKRNWTGTYSDERPPPFGNQSTSVIHRFDRMRRLQQDDVERRKVEAMKAMSLKARQARQRVASAGGEWSPLKDYENSQCKLSKKFKKKLKLQPHERSSPSYTMGARSSWRSTSTGALGPEYYVEEAFQMTSRARSPPAYSFGMRNENMKEKPDTDGVNGMAHSTWVREGDKQGFTMGKKLTVAEKDMSPSPSDYSLNFSTSQFLASPGKSFGLKARDRLDDCEGVLYSAQEAFEKSSRVSTAPAYSFRPKFPQGSVGNPDPREMAEFHIGQKHEEWDEGNQGKRGRTFGARLKDGKPAMENSPPPGAYSPSFSESKYPGAICPSFGMKLQPMTSDNSSVGPGEYEIKSTLKTTGKSFGLKTKVAGLSSCSPGPSYAPSLSSSQFASSLPKSFGLHGTTARKSPLSKDVTAPSYSFGSHERSD